MKKILSCLFCFCISISLLCAAPILASSVPDQAQRVFDDAGLFSSTEIAELEEEIRNFIEDHMTGDVMDTAEIRVMTDVDFEKLILAYDYAIRKDSAYEVENSAGDETDSQEPRMIHNGRYCYPDLRFIRRRPR